MRHTSQTNDARARHRAAQAKAKAIKAMGRNINTLQPCAQPRNRFRVQSWSFMTLT